MSLINRIEKFRLTNSGVKRSNLILSSKRIAEEKKQQQKSKINNMQKFIQKTFDAKKEEQRGLNRQIFKNLK